MQQYLLPLASGETLRCFTFSVIAALLLLSPLGNASHIFAQNKRKAAVKASDAKQKASQANNELAKTREEFVRLTEEYKKNLAVLVTSYQKEVKRAEEKAASLKELYAQGLISRRDVEASEQDVADAKAKIENARQQMKAADNQVAEMMVEAKAMEEMARMPAPAKNRLTTTTSYIRFSGAGSWLLSEAWKIQQFFQRRFGRPLPISTFGQSALHNRWSLDHRNAMDVGVSPDSVEGQALMQFLRDNGIPFSAFRGAIPGSSTGPHIHIGLPSHRYATTGWQ
ncbi:MAG: TolC family protein [Acidobacteria bacterium]|nr:TolC family protein [Acidobacteriota bacterium]